MGTLTQSYPWVQFLQTNLTHQTTDPIQILEMFLTHDPTQTTKKLKISTQPNPAQPNPTRGSTQPMDNSALTTLNKSADVLVVTRCTVFVSGVDSNFYMSIRTTLIWRFSKK